MAELVKVLLAEGHQPIKEVITQEIDGLKNVRLIGCVKSGRDLENFLNSKEELPDVILMDATIAVEDKFKITKHIKEYYPGVSSLALADSDESLYIRKMIEHGANGYILKESFNTGFGDWLMKKNPSSAMQINFDYKYDVDNQERAALGSKLDTKEKEVLKLLMNQYSSMEISEKLSMDSTEIHEIIDHLNQKTNSTNPLDLKRYAIRHSIY